MRTVPDRSTRPARRLLIPPKQRAGPCVSGRARPQIFAARWGILLAMPTTRRQFMASSALAAAALGANDQIRVALIGCGGRGRSNLELFQTDPSCRIVAICDVDQGRAEETRASLSHPPDIYSDFRRLLERKDIDAVIVATPDHWHAIPAIQ